MGCGDECPFVPGVRRDDWPLKTQWVNPSNAFGLFATTFALAWRRQSLKRARDKRQFSLQAGGTIVRAVD